MKKQTNDKFEQYIQIQLDKEKLKLEKKAQRRYFWSNTIWDFLAKAFFFGVMCPAAVMAIFLMMFHLCYWSIPAYQKQEEFDKYYRSSIAAKREQWDAYDKGVDHGKVMIGKSIDNSDAVHPKYPFNWTTNVIWTNVFMFNNRIYTNASQAP